MACQVHCPQMRIRNVSNANAVICHKLRGWVGPVPIGWIGAAMSFHPINRIASTARFAACAKLGKRCLRAHCLRRLNSSSTCQRAR
jgi:hypothetical protein